VMSPWRPPARVPLHVTALGSLTPFNCRLWSHRRVNTCFRQHRRSSLSLSLSLSPSFSPHRPCIIYPQLHVCFIASLFPFLLPPSSLLPGFPCFTCRWENRPLSILNPSADWDSQSIPFHRCYFSFSHLRSGVHNQQP